MVEERMGAGSAYEEMEIRIGDVKDLLEEYEVEVSSPDGWVGVSGFVDKGEWDEYILTTESGRTVRCNENHLFQDAFDGSWVKAKDVEGMAVLTEDGEEDASIVKTGMRIPIVDIQVDHHNHRYYTEGVSSHNTGVGKTLAMCHMAAANLVRGKNVLYITMEMSQERIAERIDCNLLNVTTDEMAVMPKELYRKKIEALKERTVGRLVIKEYPTASAGSASFRVLLNELRTKRNFIPDIIYVDYLNITMSSRIKMGASVNSYTYIKMIAEELRGLAVEFNVPIVSATQVNRTGFTSSDVGLEDTSESFGLPATADLFLAIMSDEELEKQNQIVFKQLKNRYGDPTKYRRFIVGIDRPHMRLFDAEATAQEDLMDGPFDNSSFGNRQKDEVPDRFKDLF